MKRIFNERDEALAIHYMILSRQSAELSAALMHIFNLQTKQEPIEDKEKEFRGHRASAKIVLGDMLCQIEEICKILDLNFEEVKKIGSEKNQEKREEFLKKHPDGKWF